MPLYYMYFNDKQMKKYVEWGGDEDEKYPIGRACLFIFSLIILPLTLPLYLFGRLLGW